MAFTSAVTPFWYPMMPLRQIVCSASGWFLREVAERESGQLFSAESGVQRTDEAMQTLG